MIQVWLLDTLPPVIFIEQLMPKVADVAYIDFTLTQDLSGMKDQFTLWKLN